MIGLGASTGGEAGRGSAAARAVFGMKTSGAGQCAATNGVALRLEEDATGGAGCVASGGRVPRRGVGSGGEAVREARPQGAL